jgi:hypothetical protein
MGWAIVAVIMGGAVVLATGYGLAQAVMHHRSNCRIADMRIRGLSVAEIAAELCLPEVEVRRRLARIAGATGLASPGS